jgi:predicted dehydrogenase
MKKLALIGCAHIHTPGFVRAVTARTDVKIKWVWDHDPARARKNAEATGASVATDFRSAYADAEVAGVIICSETNRHEQLVLPAAVAKKSIFVEKPLGFASADAYAMADAIEKAGVLFQTGFFQRGDAKHIFLKRQVELGNFGRITRIRGSNCHGGALGRWFDTDWRWMANPQIAGVGAFGDLGAHSLDIMIWLMGEVSAVTAQIDNGTGAYENCDETGEGLLRFKNGAIGTLAAAWDDLNNPVTLLISGTEGHAAIINGQLHFQSRRVPGFDGSQPVRNSELPETISAGFDAFLDAMAGKRATLVGAREAAYRNAVMEALYEGARQKAWVAPKSSPAPDRQR